MRRAQPFSVQPEFAFLGGGAIMAKEVRVALAAAIKENGLDACRDEADHSCTHSDSGRIDFFALILTVGGGSLVHSL